MARPSERLALIAAPFLLAACAQAQLADPVSGPASLSPLQPKEVKILFTSTVGVVARMPNSESKTLSTWQMKGGLATVQDKATGEVMRWDCQQMSDHYNRLIMAQAYTNDFSAHIKYTAQSILVNEALYGISGMDCPRPRFI